ncbi:MAG: cytochrome P450 [Acidobacteriota bacterium]
MFRPPLGANELRLGTRAFKADPYPAYARLRNEKPVLRVTLPDRRIAWLVTRFEDVASLLRDPRFVKDKKNALTPEELGREPWMPRMFRPLTRNMLDVDAPDHGRLRGIVQKGFTPRLVEGMAERIQAVADRLLDGIGSGGRFDLIRDYALPIPTTIIAEMLGVPTEDQNRFHRWSRVIVAADPSGSGMVRAVPSVMKFLRYIRRLIERRRADPRDDLISALVQAEEEGQRLNSDELVAMIFLLLVAGHETTVNLIGNGTLALLENPDQLEFLRADADLGPKAIEELLRFDGPLEFATERYAREGVEIRGATIPRGDLVYAVLASANRDERQFPDPDVLNLSRDPNRHLAFGLGVHFCLGAPLARLEGRIALTTLLRRAPDLCLAAPSTTLRRRPGLVLRGLESLPVLLRK